MNLSRAASCWSAVAIVGELFLSGCGKPEPVARPAASKPIGEPADRVEAQKRWLELAKSGNNAHKGIANAKLLMSCFKESEPASTVARILATGQKTVRGKTTEYFWRFSVEKPPSPDATEYWVFVEVRGDPPVVKGIDGGYTLD
jgi:hypothetical protein